MHTPNVFCNRGLLLQCHLAPVDDTFSRLKARNAHTHPHPRTYTHTHTHTHTHSHTHARTQARRHARTQAGRQAGTHARTHASTRTHTLSLFCGIIGGVRRVEITRLYSKDALLADNL